MNDTLQIEYLPLAAHQEEAKAFFMTHWQTDTMIISSGDYQFDDLSGMLAYTDRVVGLITYSVHGNALEIVSINSVLPHHDIGHRLMALAEEKAKAANLTKVVVSTTNDNLQAMGFYQRRGYRMTKVIRGSIDTARQRNPNIATIGENGIPVHDELMLTKLLVKPGA